MTIDVWMQHPTLRLLATDMLASLQRWTGGQIPDEELPIDATVAAMDAAGVDVGLLTAWRGPNGQDLVSNDEVAEWVRAHPTGSRVLPPSTWTAPWSRSASWAAGCARTASSD